MTTILTRYARAYWFLLGMTGVILLAWRKPGYGQFLDRHYASQFSIIGFFFLAGLTLRLDRIAQIASNWRAHALIEAFIFIVIPLTVWLTAFWVPDGPLKCGLYLLAVLPTTSASSIAFTAAADGNALVAILNAVGSNLLGIVLSPLLLSLMLGAHGFGGFDAMARTVFNMVWLVLLPFGAGQFAAIRFPLFRQKMKPVQGMVAQALVLLLSCCAFSKSLDQIASQFGELWMCFVYLVVLHLIFMGAAMAAARALRLDRGDALAVMFCATQKTLAFGMPIAYCFFSGSGLPIGVIIVPLVFYYLFQMVPASVMVNWRRGRG